MAWDIKLVGNKWTIIHNGKELRARTIQISGEAGSVPIALIEVYLMNDDTVEIRPDNLSSAIR